MRNKSVWERACGLTETVVEDVEFDDLAEAIVVSVRPDGACSWPVWSVSDDGHRDMTPVRVVVGGERWTWARLECS